MLETTSTEAQEAPATTAVAPEAAKPEVAAAPEAAKTEEPASESERQERELAEHRSKQQEALDKLRAEKAAKNGTAPPEKAETKATEKPATGATGDKTRNPDGTFKAAEPKPDDKAKAEAKPDDKAKAAATGATGEKPTDEVKKPASQYQPPAHWTKEAKAKWEAYDEDTKKYLAEDGKRIARDFTSLTTERKQLKGALEAYKPLTETIYKHVDTLKGWGMSPHEAFDGLMTTAKKLETDPSAAILDLARDYKVNIASLLNDADLSNLPPDPRLEQASTKIATLERQLANAQRVLDHERRDREQSLVRQRQTAEERAVYEQQTKAQQYRGEIDRLASELPHFDELEAEIADILPAIMKRPQYAGDQVGALKEAHRVALHANPTLSQNLIAKQIEEAEAKRRAESQRVTEAARTAAKLNAPSNASGTPATTDLDSIRAAALKRARDRQASGRAI